MVPPTVDSARRVAWEVLAAVRTHGAYVNLTLPALLRERGVEGRDAAFATELTHGTVRRQGSYDAVLATCTDRPLSRLDPGVLDVLRLGCHQLLWMRVPSHAAVDTSVDLTRLMIGHRPTSLVNAVLRKVARRDFDAWMDVVAPAGECEPLARLAIVHSHPRWIVDAFYDALGASVAETEALLRADNEAPAVTLVARPGLLDPDDLTSDATHGRWSPYARTLTSGDPGAIPDVRRGRAGVQDEGSQLVTLAAAATAVDGRDCWWLDACAGPGGKAALLAALATARDARVMAQEIHPHRALLVANSLRLLKEAVVVVADGTQSTWRNDAFDRVLVDAPCTGLGALRRRPEARWRRTAADVAPLAHLQTTLLHRSLDATRPGGVAAYVTCSPHRAETVDVVARVRADRADVDLLDATEVMQSVTVERLADVAAPYLQLWPHRHGTDGMFLALLRRR
ncbi:MAG: RsmB/NOP family class I SAM-dependent RNA methyltransferase [Nocardioidaceae bacterium]